MSKGPCLCGDPYCASCGNPAEASYADWLDRLIDIVDKYKPDAIEAYIIEQAIHDTIKRHREIVVKIIAKERERD